MQETRQYILDILREQKEATVDDIVTELLKRRGTITAVTVRHHLTRLQEDNLITTPQLRHRSAPGRPQYIYALTEEAQEHFPSNYQLLASHLVEHLGELLPSKEINVIFEGVANRMAEEAHVPDAPFPERLNAAIDYLNQHGYNAHWEKISEGYILQTNNCPYHHIAKSNQTLCDMDMRLVASLLGVVPRLLGRMSDGDASCAYMIPETSTP
jgi:predicted ArsR family transcriptional regulator